MIRRRAGAARYAGGSNFVSLDFVSDALPLPESEQR